MSAHDHFNQLTPAEHERLALLMEECAEVVQVIGKILRHGYGSCHPDGGPTNRELLAQELGDVWVARDYLLAAQDVREDHVRQFATAKAQRVSRYLHHQEGR